MDYAFPIPMGESYLQETTYEFQEHRMSLSPIILFVYNRPWHTKQTVEALLNNELASDSDLFIFSDAPKAGTKTTRVDEVRAYIHQITGFKSVTIVERETNFGLARSIIDGVTSIVNQHGKIIVLEDDLVTSPYFLKFMNDALDTYQNIEKVMHISGYNYPIDNTGIPETFFFRGSSCWGWATWDRAWNSFEKNIDKLYMTFSKQDKHKFDYDSTTTMWYQIEANKKNKMDTWAIFWYASVFKKGGLCLHPAKSMTRNIGHDGTGIHCQNSAICNSQDIANKSVRYFEDEIEENPDIVERIKHFLKNQKKNVFQDFFGKARRFLAKI